MELTAIPRKTIDQILAWQFALAWAGESPRLKWWRTDLVDEDGGGNFMQRLLPRTHRWAALEAVRRAAFLADLKARNATGHPDGLRSLYFWGFEVDEKLGERIRELKLSQAEPEAALSLPIDLRPSARFDRAALESALQQPPYELRSTGRELPGPMPEDLAEACLRLAGAHLPFPQTYPAPFYRL